MLCFAAFIRANERFFTSSFELEKEVFVIWKRLYEYGDRAGAGSTKHIREYLVADNGTFTRGNAEMRARGLDSVAGRFAAFTHCEKTEFFVEFFNSRRVVVGGDGKEQARALELLNPSNDLFRGLCHAVCDEGVVYIQNDGANAKRD